MAPRVKRRALYRVFVQRQGEPNLYLQTPSIDDALAQVRFLLLSRRERIVYIERLD